MGTGIADITPPLEVGLLMSSTDRRWAPFEGIRLPLHARAVVIERDSQRVGLVSLELLGLADEAVGGLERFKQDIVLASGQAVSSDQLILTATHTHSAPESLALSDLYRTSAFRAWIDLLAERIGVALRSAREHMCRCSLGTSSARVEGLAIHRRIKTINGVVLSHPEPPPETVLSRGGAVDPLVNVAVFRNEANRPICILVNATCHAVHEMCCPRISPDYPGVMSAALEDRFPGATSVFFNGAAGNINPPTVSDGPAAANRHGLRLAEVIGAIVPLAQPVRQSRFALMWRPIALPARTPSGRASSEPLHARIAGLSLGDVAFLFFPGEPFVEIALAVRDRSPFDTTFLIGYAEASIGYIPTDEAFNDGGYETGPGAWSRLDRGSEKIVREAGVNLLNELMHFHEKPPVNLDQNAGCGT